MEKLIPENLFLQDKVIYTSEELISAGIKVPADQPEPESVVCEFCGNKIVNVCAVLLGEFRAWIPTTCSCEGATRHRAEKEKQEEQRIAEELQEKEREEMREKIQGLLGSSGIKKRYLSKTLDTYQQTKDNKRAIEIAQEYINNFGKYQDDGIGLYIEGTTGTGKTHLATAISLQLIERGVPVVFCTFGELLFKLRSAYDTRSRVTEEEIVQVFLNADLLVIDDLGKETPSEWTLDRLYYIINDRNGECRPTIITTNYNQEALKKRLNHVGGDGKTAAAIVSRLRECCDVITLVGEDWREKL